ncbi:hypothetical protein DY78_GL002243 [Lactiplantibacillus fabifermentans DSM 21115]|uniref:Uncharacterized protein n=1 Tax=Lactiplantibacillus fabifermentans DSM 21115 TaxID=1413187 RepID=A0A0R2NY44_9LACO|nr:hypothetical protein DY78_GL002243 [Lactiplantibacillus fabifermentans DSM 21115]
MGNLITPRDFVDKSVDNLGMGFFYPRIIHKQLLPKSVKINVSPSLKILFVGFQMGINMI